MKIRRLGILLFFSSLIIAGTYFLANDRQPASTSRSVSLELESPSGLAAGSKTGQELIAFWQSRFQRDPRDYISLTYLGYAHTLMARQSGDVDQYQQARSALLQALDLNPDDETALALLSAVHLNMHEFQAALETAERVYAVDPEALQALATIGDASIELGNYQRAQTAYATLLQASPTPPVFSRMARLEWLQGRPDSALEWMRKAAQEAMDSGLAGEQVAWYQFQLGDFYFDQGSLDQAEVHFAMAQDLFDGYYLALAGLGEVHAARGDYLSAIEYYEQALAVSPAQPDFLASLGYLYQLVGQQEQAERYYAAVEALATESDFSRRIYNRELSLFYSDSDIKLEQALELAEWEITLRQDVHGYDALAWALYKNGRYAEGLQAIEQAMSLGTRDPNILFHAGMLYAAVGDGQRAARLLSEALSINPHFDLYASAIARQTLAGLQSN